MNAQQKQQENNERSTTSGSVREISNDGWNGAHVLKSGTMLTQGYQDELRNALVLDSASSVDLLCNPKMVTNITKSNKTLRLGTNSREATANQQADFAGYGKVWFNPNSITNIISLAGMANKYRV